MNFQLEKPAAVVKAGESHRGLNWALELLVFVLVFVVSSIAETLVILPIALGMLLSDTDFRAALAAGNPQGIIDASVQVGTADISMICSLFATIGMILIVILFCKLIQKRKLDTLGFMQRGAVKEYLFGAAAGFIAFSAAVLICVLTGSLQLNGFSSAFGVGIFLLFLFGFMVQGMAEEVMCRGYLMVSIGRRYPMWVAAVLNALIFAALHLANSGISALAFVNLTLFGIFASVYFIKRGNIWGIAAFHSVWNLVQGNFYGIRVSGMETSCTVFESTSVAGRDIVNGGAFGLEGGLAVTAVLVAGILLLLRFGKTCHSDF